MKKQWLWIIALSIGTVTTAFCGNITARGEVSGRWNSGSVVHVESAIRVATGASLIVENGVQIIFATTDPFIVDGNLICEGTENAPISIEPSKDWKGIFFRNLSQNPAWNELRFVNIAETGHIASGIVKSEGALIHIYNCRFISRDFGLNIEGGKIRAADNFFLTYGPTSRVVTLSGWTRAISEEEFSYLDRNLIQIDGTQSDTHADQHDQWAVGLDVDGLNGLYMRGNAIQLWQVPNTSVGVNIGHGFVTEGEDIHNVNVSLQECVVKITTDSIYSSYGILCIDPSIASGSVRFEKATIDVAAYDPFGFRRPFAVRLDHNTHLTLNSSAVRCSSTGSPIIPYFVEDHATLQVEYSLRWFEALSVSEFMTAPSDLPDSDPKDDYARIDEFLLAGGDTPPSDLPPGVTEIEVISDQDPGFSQVIGEGIWTSQSDVEAYFGLLEISPCRETGDPRIDENPNDDNLPDMGCFEYAPVPHAADPIFVIPSDLAMSSAYPNPFNPSTSLRIELAHSGLVRMIAYDILGREVGTLMNHTLNSGTHTVGFDGSGLASGVYLLTIEYNGGFVGAQKLVLMK
jgi:hypothetical protein